MKDIQVWCSLVCLTALGCTAVRLLAPKDGVGKLFRLITVSFFLCCFISPLLKISSSTALAIDWMPPETVSELLDNRVTKQLKSQVEQAVEEVVIKAFSERNLLAQKIVVETDISDEGNIYIKQITVTVDKQNIPASAVVREVLAKQLKTTVTIKTKD